MDELDKDHQKLIADIVPAQITVGVSKERFKTCCRNVFPFATFQQS